jgi:hypothetical protein
VVAKGLHEIARWRKRLNYGKRPRPAISNKRKKAHGRR